MRDRVVTQPKQRPTSFANTKPVSSLPIQSRELRASMNQCSAASSGTGQESSTAAATNTKVVISVDIQTQKEPDTHLNTCTERSLGTGPNEKIKYCSSTHTHTLLRQTHAHFRLKTAELAKAKK